MAENRSYNNNKKKQSDDSLELGKIPPQAVELEEIVLGAIMIESDAIVEVGDILKSESFYKEAHQHIYRAVIKLSEEHEPIDLMTVIEKLRKENQLEAVGGPQYLAELTSRVNSSAHIEYHARIIAQKYIQRELIRISSEIQNKAFDTSSDVDDLLDFSEKELFNLAYGNIKKDATQIDAIITEAIKQLEEASKRADGLSGVPCGFTELDAITSGWQRSDLVIIAARPSMGKTAFVLSMARNIGVNHNTGVALFSLEMSSVQLVNRLIVSETEIPADRVRTGKLSKDEWEQLNDKIDSLFKAPIFIDDTPAISLFELRAKCRRLKMQHDISLVVVDYLQLMTAGGDSKGMNREQEVSIISRGLKAIAKELNIPIIALSQLNRSVETRGGDKRPQLSDLRESGAIEQDADIVLFIHRPERYGIVVDEDGNSLIGLAEIIIAKHRNGSVGDVKLKFKSEFARFMDLDANSLSGIGSDLELIQPSTVTFSSSMNSDSGNSKKDLDEFSYKNTSFEDEQAPF
jgi:replicative DNA helicase